MYCREFDSNRCSKRLTKSANKCPGFTLIELLVAITIIGVLIALLLPAIQMKREEYASNKAWNNVNALALASAEYKSRRGTYPNNLNELFNSCASAPGICAQVDPQLATGHAGGYGVILANTEGDFHITADPETPGITGSMTHIFEASTGMIRSEPTPGSDQARQRAFDNLLVSGANLVSNLLGMDPNAIDQARSYAEMPSVVPDATAYADYNGDGVVDAADLFSTHGGPFAPEINGFLQQVYRDFRWDRLNQGDLSQITVSDINGDASLAFFSYDELRNLTALTIIPGGTSNTVLATLTNLLDKAQAAESSGNTSAKAKALKQYRKLVKSERGHAFTRTNAVTLMTLSDVLVSD